MHGELHCLAALRLAEHVEAERLVVARIMRLQKHDRRSVLLVGFRPDCPVEIVFTLQLVLRPGFVAGPDHLGVADALDAVILALDIEARK